MSLDLDELEKAIESMTYRQNIYKTLRRALQKKGYWRALPRGDPAKGYKISHNHKGNQNE